MSKKKDTVLHADLKNEPEKKTQLLAVTLAIGKWKSEFTEHEYKVMIAKALNYCVCHNEMKIVGYLITKRRICLVFATKNLKKGKLLKPFYERMKLEIYRYSVQLRRSSMRTFEEETVLQESRLHPFVESPLKNDDLIKLLLGRKVDLAESPHLKKMKGMIRRYNFCSAMDYSGAKGPVIIKLITNPATV